MDQNLCKVSIPLDGPGTVLHTTLKLTGCELSVNNIPAGAAVPFVHSYQDNEEVYVVLEGRGELYLDGEVIPIEKGGMPSRLFRPGKEPSAQLLTVL